MRQAHIRPGVQPGLHTRVTACCGAVFGNLANKPLTDTTWVNMSKLFQNQLTVARYFTEATSVATDYLATLRGAIVTVTPDTDVSTVDKIVQIIGTVPPGG